MNSCGRRMIQLILWPNIEENTRRDLVIRRRGFAKMIRRHVVNIYIEFCILYVVLRRLIVIFWFWHNIRCVREREVKVKEPMAPWRCHMMSHQKLIKKAISISIGNNSCWQDLSGCRQLLIGDKLWKWLALHALCLIVLFGEVVGMWCCLSASR
jgi:hypothetical protein